MAQKVERREKLEKKVGRREIYPPVPPPSLKIPEFTVCYKKFLLRELAPVHLLHFLKSYQLNLDGVLEDNLFITIVQNKSLIKKTLRLFLIIASFNRFLLNKQNRRASLQLLVSS